MTRFTPVEIRHAQNKPTLTVPQLLKIKSCKDYAETPLQTLDSLYVTQPKRFLPLAQEAKKLAEEFRKEEIASQWAGLPPEKLLQESFIEQLNALQSLDQLAPLTAAKEHLPGDIINILKLLGKVDNIPFNQLYNFAEDCADRYYTKVIKTLTCLFHDRQWVLVNSAVSCFFLFQNSHLGMTWISITLFIYLIFCMCNFKQGHLNFLNPIPHHKPNCGKCSQSTTIFMIIFMT